jgi:hypothetical protein
VRAVVHQDSMCTPAEVDNIGMNNLQWNSSREVVLLEDREAEDR